MSAPTPSGWADERMSMAYEAVAAVKKGLSRHSDAYTALECALDAIEQADEEIVNSGLFRERLSDALADGIQHRSDCAIYLAPAFDPEPCTCGTPGWRRIAAALAAQINHAGCTCTFPDDKCCGFAMYEAATAARAVQP